MSRLEVFDSYAQKISDESSVPYIHVIRLRDMGLLDEKSVRDFLIRHDCDALLKTKKFTDTQVYNKLAGIYDLDVRQIQYIINTKWKKPYYCTCCGKQISRIKFMRNQGLCDKCLSNKI